ncbi:hypothetical protein D3C74_316340 [compost metagenome]
MAVLYSELLIITCPVNIINQYIWSIRCDIIYQHIFRNFLANIAYVIYGSSVNSALTVLINMENTIIILPPLIHSPLNPILST